MKQLLKDTAAFCAVTAFVTAAYSWSTGSNAISLVIANVGSATIEHVGSWIDNLTVFQACALLYAIWIAASFFAFVVEAYSDRPRTLVVSTLMFGSFGTTVVGMTIVIFVGLRA